MMDPGLVNRDLRMAGRVLRYACWPTLVQQTVADHCWQVARIYAELWGPPERDVAYYIQNHDSAELVVGDPPYPVKAENPDLKAAHDRLEPAVLASLGVALPELDPTEKARVKVCDLLEMTSFGMTEVEMGNRLAIPIVQRTSAAAISYASKTLSPDDYFAVGRYAATMLSRHNVVLNEGEYRAAND